ncbi:gliding motility-associated-like protein [Lutibacter sp. Hel_I_33_5]|uniref:T9SS type B sorting domain-containing protein n=1 Tax=Lutibacter sp. Hel_I_33_5 TaxID=1566289 RepID=UPI0011AAA5B3|nr:choice-of-anchor L domain-containing protein [Lutibacter sp. Hel_I_33_5]TVZ54974.1 gliding motility-associated-like protein [Lutibacter sp. Hel_I_33_5]
MFIPPRITKWLFLIAILCFCNSGFSQVTVNDSNLSSQGMVDLLLSNSCATRSNISVSSNQSVAYFSNNGSNFPLNEGIIIRNGIATHTQGIYTGNNLNSQLNTNSDADLQTLSNQSNQPAQITDVAFLEFDFTPSSTNFSFNFLFASNEYGEWQCGFSDVFGFFLTDLTTGITKNIAVVPNTQNAISVKEIRDNQYNSSCNSTNPELFNTYNVDTPANSSVNMRGFTNVLTASSLVTPNNPYRIKFAIGDYNDATFDSAVFIQAGSFDTFLNLGEDSVLCSGDTTQLNSGYTNTTNFSYEWLLNDVAIPNEINTSLTVNQPGTYKLNITNTTTNCIISDEVIISTLQVNQPNDLQECSGNNVTFNLTLNNTTALNVDENIYDILYYNSIENATNNLPIADNLLSQYPSGGNETIFIRLRNKNTNTICTDTVNFNLNITNIEATRPSNITVCQTDQTLNIPDTFEQQILNNLNPLNYTVSYFRNENEAESNINAIVNPENYPLIGSGITILWARLTDNTNSICFDVVDFNITINLSPPITTLENVYVCSEYTLQPLANGNYFTGPQGTGTQLNAGDLITNQSTVYIYNSNPNGCFNETNFTINMADEYTVPLVHCGTFTVPSYPNSVFYDATNGPNGTGTIIPSGTEFTTNQTIFFYAINEDDSICVDTQFDIIVNPLPPVDTFENVITCDSYTLPPITNGNYFTEIDGGGTQLNAGVQVTSTQTIHVFNIDAVTNCTNSSLFNVTIIDTSVFQNLSACGNYRLPNVEFGGYFTEAVGGGTPIAIGTTITSSQTVFYFAPEITDNTNCTDNISIDITINPLPPVDSLENIIRCQDDLPTLPALTNGNYFTLPGGQGTQLNTGAVINTTQTVFIYNTNQFCDAQTSFTVEIRPFPIIDNFTDVFVCDTYTLPQLSNGRYYTESGAQGTQLNAGEVITTNQRIFIFNDYSDLEGCTNENFFTVNILKVEVDELEDIKACDTYILPPLTVGNYFTEQNGQGTQLNAGETINTTQTIYIYSESGTRIVCSDQSNFTVTISNTPILPVFNDIENCNSFTLPSLTPITPITGVDINYYRQPNGIDKINIADYTISEIGTQKIYVRAFTQNNLDCFTETSFDLTVHPLLDLVILDAFICEDSETGLIRNTAILETGLNPNEFTANWYLDNQLVGTGVSYEADQEGIYRIEFIKLIPDVGANCTYNPTEVLVRKSTPKAAIEFLTPAFSSNSTVRVNFSDEGLGSYQFKLDDGEFQESNTFRNVGFGNHTIIVKDITEYCGDFVFNFTAIETPNFFTPNGDGINDVWNIHHLKNNPEAIVTIYNRFGKLIYTFKPSTGSWNGYTNTGNLANASDYWFIVAFTFQGKHTEFRSNLSLIRN